MACRDTKKVWNTMLGWMNCPDCSDGKPSCAPLDLLAEQEELGEPFVSVLHENLWDLYAR
jgi:hypothetical protein